MSTNDAGTLERGATDDSTESEIIDAGDGGEILEAETPDYTYHREPSSVGGARYIRCEHCGRESVPANPERLLHRKDCPLAERGGRDA